MSRALIIGAGGVAGVVAHKCCENFEVFSDIMIASRTKEKCDSLKERCEAYKKKVGSGTNIELSLIHISEPTRQAEISYAVFCLKKKKTRNKKKKQQNNKKKNNKQKKRAKNAY